MSRVIPTILLDSHTPPANLGYLVAAFAVAWLFFLGYTFYMKRRAQEMLQEIKRLRRESEEGPDAPASPVPDREGTGGG